MQKRVNTILVFETIKSSKFAIYCSPSHCGEWATNKNYWGLIMNLDHQK